MLENWHTLREIDEACGRPKGSAFRVFKRHRPAFAEGRDFRVLEHERDAALIAGLRVRGRIYRSSVNVILLTEGARAAVIRDLTNA